MCKCSTSHHMYDKVVSLYRCRGRRYGTAFCFPGPYSWCLSVYACPLFPAIRFFFAIRNKALPAPMLARGLYNFAGHVGLVQNLFSYFLLPQRSTPPNMECTQMRFSGGDHLYITLINKKIAFFFCLFLPPPRECWKRVTSIYFSYFSMFSYSISCHLLLMESIIKLSKLSSWPIELGLKSLASLHWTRFDILMNLFSCYFYFNFTILI